MITREKSVMCDVDEMEAINFCRALGRYSVKFEISDLRSAPKADDDTKKRYFRVFIIHGPKKQMDELCKRLNLM